MPNWCEGTLKIKGRADDVLKFLTDGIECYRYTTDHKYEEVKNITKVEELDDVVKYSVCYTIPSDAWLYVKGTKRAFPEGAEYMEIEIWEEDGIAATWIPIKQAWGFVEDDWVELSKLYGVDFHLYGIECGCEFMNEIVVENGRTVKNETISCESHLEWIWNCPFPDMGG